MVARWVVTRVGGDKYPKPRESKIDTTGAGAGCAPGRGGVLVVGARGGWGLCGGAPSFGCVGDAGGVALSPWWWVGLVVTISLGSVRGLGGGWGLGGDNRGGGVGWLVSWFWLRVGGLGWLGVWVVVVGLVWLVVGCGGCWGWLFFVLFCWLFFGVFLLLFVCFGVGWWVCGGVVGCVGLSVGACCCLVGGWCVVGLLGGGLCWLGVGWWCGLWLVVWCSAGGVLVVLGEWHGVWCVLPGCLYVVGAVVGAVSAACAVGVWVWVGCGLVWVGVGAWWWVLVECVGVCVFFVEVGGGLGGGLGGADL